MKRRFSLGLPLAVALLAMGCGGDEGGKGGGGGSNKIDACAIVTESDATALFGQTASKDTGAQIVDPALRGECLWSYQNANNDSHLLQFRVWQGQKYYVPGTNAEPFDIGDEGAVDMGALIGVDVQWLQGESAASLSYSTVGNVPGATTKLAEVKALALATAAKLK
ncbi:MAG: hypothetical protein IPI67_02725 [Myxococcales bacterium]|nr:hypothetical protein [Myxococcales bacterium]